MPLTFLKSTGQGFSRMSIKLSFSDKEKKKGGDRLIEGEQDDS